MGGRRWVGVLHYEAACRPPTAADAGFHGFLSVVLRPVAHVPRGGVINGHGSCLVETMVRNEGAVSSPQLLLFTEPVPLGQWQNQGSVPGNERELHLPKM